MLSYFQYSLYRVLNFKYRILNILFLYIYIIFYYTEIGNKKDYISCYFHGRLYKMAENLERKKKLGIFFTKVDMKVY